jgi:hypothetical protein
LFFFFCFILSIIKAAETLISIDKPINISNKFIKAVSFDVSDEDTDSKNKIGVQLGEFGN